jgi:curved DNA-binding protein CbpA
MMQSPQEAIDEALEILELPKLITKADIKKQYRFLSKKNHPDTGGDEEKQEQLTFAYSLLMKYIEEFRYTFDEKEVSNQFPGADHANRFRP